MSGGGSDSGAGALVGSLAGALAGLDGSKVISPTVRRHRPSAARIARPAEVIAQPTAIAAPISGPATYTQ